MFTPKLVIKFFPTRIRNVLEKAMGDGVAERLVFGAVAAAVKNLLCWNSALLLAMLINAVRLT